MNLTSCVAMLWDCPGYQVEAIVRFTEQHLEVAPSGLHPRPARSSVHLVDHDDVEEQHLETAVRPLA